MALRTAGGVRAGAVVKRKAGDGLAVDLGLVASDTGGGAPKRGFGAFEARGAALDGFVGAQDVVVRALVQRGALFVQAPGPLLENALALVQILLPSIGARLAFVGKFFTTVGQVIADVGEAITLVGDRVAAVGDVGPLLLIGRSRLAVAAGGSR